MGFTLLAVGTGFLKVGQIEVHIPNVLYVQSSTEAAGADGNRGSHVWAESDELFNNSF